MSGTVEKEYSTTKESRRLLEMIIGLVDLPEVVKQKLQNEDEVLFTAENEYPYFPIPFKETETGAALKAIEAAVALALQNTRKLSNSPDEHAKITINLEKTTAFLFQAYLAQVLEYGKLDKKVKEYLDDTDFKAAQSNPYHRMAANLFKTKDKGRFYHIHGSLDTATTLGMIGLPPSIDNLEDHLEIVKTIETATKKYTVDELDVLNMKYKQAGIPALKHEEFLGTPHGKVNWNLPPWTVDQMETETTACPLPGGPDEKRPLAGIKVLEMCRIIAGPVMGRILAEYGADVLKITGPNISDVPFFQVDGNMGKHAAQLDLKDKSEGGGLEAFIELAKEADVILDGYRPGVLDRLGIGRDFMLDMAKKRDRGIVYVNENCFGYDGDWKERPGWQQIADCATGVAWAQGEFMDLSEPVVPPFPISDYGTGCMGAIAALTGLYRRATEGGSYHGKASLMHYDLLLFKAGKYDEKVQQELKARAGDELLKMKYHNSVDQISGNALEGLMSHHEKLFKNPKILEVWNSTRYTEHAKKKNRPIPEDGKVTVTVVKPVAEIDGLELGFKRASRPNALDTPDWESFSDYEGEGCKPYVYKEKSGSRDDVKADDQTATAAK